MNNRTQILAITVMTISGLMLLISLAGIFGIWILRSQMAADLVWLAAEAETRINRVQQGVDQIDTNLISVNEQLVRVEEDLQAIGDDVDQNRPLVTAISDRLDLGILPRINSLRETLNTVLETVDTANDTINSINTLRFISIPTAELERLENLSQSLDDLDTQIQELRNSVDLRRSEIIQGTVDILLTPTSQMINVLDELQIRVSTISEQLVALQERLANFQKSITGWLTGIAVLVTLVLLWAVFSQVVLIRLGWLSFKGHDLLLKITSDEEKEHTESSNL
jgi:hypothetical protein